MAACVAKEQPLAGFLAGRDLGGLPKKLTGGRLGLRSVEILRPRQESGPQADNRHRKASKTSGHQQLALGELEALTRALLSVFLAFLHARIARQKSVLAKRRPQLRIEP